MLFLKVKEVMPFLTDFDFSKHNRFLGQALCLLANKGIDLDFLTKNSNKICTLKNI